MIRRILSLIGVSKAHILTPTAGSIPSGPYESRDAPEKFCCAKFFFRSSPLTLRCLRVCRPYGGYHVGGFSLDCWLVEYDQKKTRPTNGERV